MSFRDSLFLTAIIYYVVPLILTAALSWAAFTYVLTESSPAGSAASIGAHLSASSILFGFVSFLFRSSVQETEALNNKAADAANELSAIHEKVKGDKLSTQQFSYRTRIDGYGRDSAFGISGEAATVIRSAFNFLWGPFRLWVKLARRIIYLFYVTALLFLGSSIVLFLVSDSLANTTSATDIGSFILVLSLPPIVVGAYLSNRDLTVLNDTLMNIRQAFTRQLMETPSVQK